MHNISRRTFTATMAGTAAVAATGVLGMAQAEEPAAVPGWLGPEPATPDTFAAEYVCDVVVCGLGLAGVSATRAAVEAGATVVAIEKGTGFGLGSKDMCAIGSKTFVERFPEIEPYWADGEALLMNEVSKNCLYRNNAKLMRKWLEINGDNVDWYISAVPEDKLSIGTSANGNAVDPAAPCALTACSWPLPANFNPYEENLPCLPGSYNLGGAEAKAWLACNLDLAQEEAGEKLLVKRLTRAVKLVKENGRVTGVIATNEDGEYIKINALKGVVLGTGDFINNQEMIEALVPNIVAGGYEANGTMAYYRVPGPDGLNTDTGDGHKMAIWAGAKMQDYGCSMSHFGGGNNSSVWGTMPYLMLDLQGHRYMNEDVQGQQAAERMRELPGRCALQLFDSKWPEQLCDMPYGHGKFPNRTQADIDARLEAGTLYMADTLEELLDNFDVDVPEALKSIERYNELCHLGKDLDFAKTPKRMFALENPPYFASCMNRGDDLVTMSGINSDELCHALDPDYNPIPGLFVAGNVQGGRFASIYPEIALGISVAMAMAFGREAGTNAALEL